MYKEKLQELAAYLDELEYIGCKERTMDDILLYIKSKNVSESTINRYKKAFKEEISWVIHKDGRIKLDREQMIDLIEHLHGMIYSNDISFGPCVTGESLNQVKTTTSDLMLQKKSLEQELGARRNQVKEQNAKIKKLTEEVKKLEKKVEELNKEKAAMSVGNPILILDSANVLPCKDAFEKQFVKIGNPEEKKDDKVLTEKNYKTRKIQKIFSREFLEEKLRRLLEKSKKSKFITDKVYVKNLLEDKHYTNQEKLALYAAFSDYRHTDMEKLLNFAGDCNINADLVIKWAESLVDKTDYLQLKNSLRQFAKPSEFQMKHELAKELLLGEWIVEFQVNDDLVRFKLVSEKDIEIVKEALELPNTAFSYVELEEKKDINKEEEEMMKKKDLEKKGVIKKKPSFIKRYNINDGFQDFDVQDEAVSIDDVENEEG